MKLFAAAVLIASLSQCLATASQAQVVRISNDMGGQIGPYMDRLANLRQSGDHVVIDGNCLSACTLTLGVIPRERICVTARARLGFHAAWRPDEQGRPIPSKPGTKMMMETYPQLIRQWIIGRGGLTTKMIYLQGRKLRTFYKSCNEQQMATLQ